MLALSGMSIGPGAAAADEAGALIARGRDAKLAAVSPLHARIVRIALDVVLIAAISIGAMKLFELGLHELAATAFWKTWAAQHSTAGRLVPALGVALACGCLGGIVLGGFAGGRARVLGCFAGLVVIALDFGGTIASEGLSGLMNGFALAPLCIALGLLAGAALGGKLMRGPRE